MLAIEDIDVLIQSKLAELRSRFYINQIGIFGSYAKNLQTENSDIDFVVHFRDDCPDYYEVKHQLKRYLRNILGKDVDVANAEFLKPYVLERIKAEIHYV
ncbi:MAG: nucleotidyltransferase domain-containing protein [Candidatus Cloacimonas sp.]|jgi:predicted nucleotidyltransferase|nr:nucleotidyltransferase domain-containing protein [Candidatus Cloacimonas sp.]